MKKLLPLFLALALLVPSAALAYTGDSPYFGEWAAQKHGSTANYSAMIYYLCITQYKTSHFFEFDLFHGGGLSRAKVGYSEAYAGSWEIVDDHLRIPTSAIEYIEVFYDEKTDTLYTKEWPQLTFVRLP